MDLILVGNDKPDMLEEDVSVLCAEVEDAVRPLLDKSQVALRTAVAPNRIHVEKDLFKLLCTNLIDNAVKASKPGGFVYLRGFVIGDSKYALEVADEGIGIPEEDVEKVFEPFFVVDRFRSKAQHGAGLGLAICAGIVRLHGASIDIKSRLNEGTTVRIVFPI
jgi:signal transduction histidine kinase